MGMKFPWRLIYGCGWTEVWIQKSVKKCLSRSLFARTTPLLIWNLSLDELRQEDE